MQQRLSIAQSVIRQPKILLLDEPFGALDPGITLDLHKLILELWAANAMTIFMITHDIKESFQLGTRLLVFDKVRHDPQAPDAIRRACHLRSEAEEPTPSALRCRSRSASQRTGLKSMRAGRTCAARDLSRQAIGGSQRVVGRRRGLVPAANQRGVGAPKSPPWPRPPFPRPAK